MTERYYTAFGSYPEPTKACYTMMGPQAADQIPEQVKVLLDLPGVNEVQLIFDHGLGERINVFRKIPDRTEETK